MDDAFHKNKVVLCIQQIIFLNSPPFPLHSLPTLSLQDLCERSPKLIQVGGRFGGENTVISMLDGVVVV